MKTNQWKTIEDKNVRCIWECPNCEKEAAIHPDFYVDLGTPVCPDCDEDMAYIRTEINA